MFFLSRSRGAAEAVLAQAEVAAIVDLGKPFASRRTPASGGVLLRKPARLRST